MSEVKPKKTTGVLLTLFILAFATGLISWSLYRLWRGAGNKDARLTISAGSETGMRQAIAQTLTAIAGKDDLELELRPTDGSIDALSLVDRGELQLALVQGGLTSSSFKNVRQVAVMHVEPLHLLVKQEGEGRVPDHWTIETIAERFKADRKLTVNLSKQGSGTFAIASDLMEFFDLMPGKDYEPVELGYKQLMDPQRTTESLPDIVFTVSSLPSPVAKHLIHEHGYRPLELNVANAYRLDWSAQEDSDGQSVVRRKVVSAVIPAYTYQVRPPVPKDDVKTIGGRLQLVANKDVDTEAIEKLVATVYTSSFAATSDPPLDVDLLNAYSEYPLHQGAQNYLEYKSPFITEKLVEVTEQILAILGTIAGALLFAWQAAAFMGRRRRDEQFLQCILRVGEIEHRAMDFETNDDMTIDDLIQLQHELNEVKSEMIEQFQQGNIEGADTLSGFLMHVNDANENLTRMILHEREPRLPSS